MKKISLHFIFTILISSALITSCNSENSVKTTEKEVTNDNEATHSIEIDIVDHDFEFMPPSPIQIASILKKANMSYEEGLTNDISNADIYSTKFKQTINFGVYACDLAYCVTNDKYEEAGKYLKVAKKMSAKIGLESIFQSDHLVERFEKNIGNQDSIMDILFHVQMMTDDYIHDNDLRDLSVRLHFYLQNNLFEQFLHQFL